MVRLEASIIARKRIMAVVTNKPTSKGEFKSFLKVIRMKHQYQNSGKSLRLLGMRSSV
jgi:hypothetical protein